MSVSRPESRAASLRSIAVAVVATTRLLGKTASKAAVEARMIGRVTSPCNSKRGVSICCAALQSKR